MVAGGALVPALPLVLIGPTGEKTPPIMALIDSGADCSSFPSGIMASLGIDAASCTQRAGMTAGGRSKFYEGPQPVQVDLLGKTLNLKPHFNPTLPVVLLGRNDFFSVFKVGFDQRKRRFSLEPY